MVETKLYVSKIKRVYHSAVDAWWVILIIICYSIIAWLFSGTSCLLASTLGIPCPACGTSRAIVELLQGDFIGSLRYHPLLIPGIIVFGIYFSSVKRTST